MENIPLISSIKKVDEFTDPKLLDANVVTRLENLVLDKVAGKAVKRNGFSLYGTATGSGNGYKLHDLMGGDGNNYLVAGVGTTLKTSSNGTSVWATLLGANISSGAKLRVASYQNKHIITDQGSHLFTTDLANVWGLGITAPAVTSITTEHLSGGQLTESSEYKYCLTYTTLDGESSSPSINIAHYIGITDNAATDTINRTIVFHNLPVSSDSRVVSKSLWRTQGGSNTLYLLDTLNNTLTDYTDSAPDTSLDLSKQLQYMSVPTTAKNLLIHKERLFLANITVPDLVINPTWSKVASNGVTLAGTGRHSTEGALTAGAYGYKVMWRDKSGRNSAALPFSVALTGIQNEVFITNLPTIPSANIEGRIYRTKVGGSTYYYLGSYTQQTQLIDDTADSGLSTETLPSATTSSSTFKNGIAFSEIGLPNQVSFFNPNDPTESYLIQVHANDGDEITGIVDYIDRLIIFKKNSISQLLTSGAPENWSIDLVTSEIGCDQPESIVKTMDNIYFVHNGQVYTFSDYMKTNFTKNPLSNDIRLSLTGVTMGLTVVNDACYSSINSWYIMIATVDSENIVFIYDEKTSSWYKFTSSSLHFESVSERKYTDRGVLIFGTTNYSGIVKYDPSALTDYNNSTGDPIIGYLTSRYISVNLPTSLIRLRTLRANYTKKAGASQDVTHLLYDIDTQKAKIYTDNTTYLSDTNVTLKVPTDQMTGYLMTSGKLDYAIYGSGLMAFDIADLDFRIISRGSRNV